MGIARIAARSTVLRVPWACSDLKAPPEPSALSGSIPITFFMLKKLLQLQQLSLFGEGDGNRTHVRKHLHGSVSERSL